MRKAGQVWKKGWRRGSETSKLITMKRHPGFKDLTGKRFGLLVVLREADNRSGRALWVCRCDCGKETSVRGGNLKRNHSKSCGCSKGVLITKAKTRHGCSLKGKWTGEYQSWSGMLQRCRSDKDYAGRGISVCQRWKLFRNFYEDLGKRPSQASIERTNNDGSYSCGACEECASNGWSRNGRWAGRLEQARNTRANKFYTFNNETLCGSAWAERIGISHRTLFARFKAGWSIDRALTTPLLQ